MSHTPSYTPTTATVYVCATSPPAASILPPGQAFIMPVDSGDIYNYVLIQDRATCCTLCFIDQTGCNGYSIGLGKGLAFSTGYCTYLVGNPTNADDGAKYPGDLPSTPQCPAAEGRGRCECGLRTQTVIIHELVQVKEKAVFGLKPQSEQVNGGCFEKRRTCHVVACPAGHDRESPTNPQIVWTSFPD